MDYKWQAERREMNKKTAELKRNKADKTQIESAENEYATKDRQHSDLVDPYLKKNKNYGKVGAFEGAGYVAKGMYRPMLDCIMLKGTNHFVKFARQIMKVIEQYTE